MTSIGTNSRAESRIPFGRLLLVETRKLFDTLGGAVITATTIVLAVAAIAARGVVSGPRLHTLYGTAGIGYGILLPVLGILTVTNEWSQRTALTTFALEPRRWRVLAAKCLPPLLTAVAAALFAILVAVPVTAGVAAIEGGPADWAVSPLVLLGWVATNVILVAMGLALGMLLLNAPSAIVICLSTTALWSVIGSLGAVGAALADWLDLSTTSAALTQGGLTGAEAARLATSVACWIVAPLVVGVLRVSRKEVN